MKTKTKNKLIHSTLEKVFAQMDDFSKTGMHMCESSMMMMGSKLKLEQLSINSTGVGAVYRWHGKMMGKTMEMCNNDTAKCKMMMNAMHPHHNVMKAMKGMKM